MKLIPLRKNQLRNKISQAIKVGDQDHLLFLRSKLVHRYGVESLYDSETENNDFLELNTEEKTKESISLEIEGTKLPDEASHINNLIISEESIGFKGNADSSEQKGVDNLPDDENIESSESVEKIAKTVSDLPPLPIPMAPTPPIPQLSSLRRWLTTNEEKMPKAS